jgi:putative restriction endonuclease
MRYWWVNQNQTHRKELKGGYLWSPKRNANEARNPFYEFMREVAPGHVVFSFVDTKIIAIGIVTSYCYENPKPAEFGGTGAYWNTIGWRVRVTFSQLHRQIRPKDHMGVLHNVLPAKYSPLQTSGNGNQGVYLTTVSEALAQTLIGLIGAEAINLLSQPAVDPFSAPTRETADLEVWENHIERTIQEEPDLSETERESLVIARRGQGLYKQRVMQIESKCRITKVDNPAHLRASHCKPWRDCISNEERLDGENALLLTPSIDHLFDRGFISFENTGRLIIAPVAHLPSLQRMGVSTDQPVNVGGFSEGQRRFLDYHRNSVLLMASH